MNNDNLIIQSSEGTIEYIGDSLLESALKKDMEFPLGCSAGMICDNDHYLLLVLRTEILTSEIKKILEMHLWQANCRKMDQPLLQGLFPTTMLPI